MEYVFISYSTKNQIAAESVRKILLDNGINSWMAPHDIPPGERYAGVINQAIKACSCFVLLLSEDAQNSVWVAKECERAVNYRKTLIPVQLEEVVLNDEFELYISSNHAIPLFRIDPDSEPVRRILDAIRACLGIKAVKADPTVKKRKIPAGRGYYYGAFPENGPITGHGEFVYDNGDRYVGDFVNGKREGHGEYLFANGDRYVGVYAKDKPEGHCEYLFANGNRYVGDFLDDNFSCGVLYDPQENIIRRYP